MCNLVSEIIDNNCVRNHNAYSESRLLHAFSFFVVASSSCFIYIFFFLNERSRRIQEGNVETKKPRRECSRTCEHIHEQCENSDLPLFFVVGRFFFLESDLQLESSGFSVNVNTSSLLFFK